jgi:hypothetical protein
MAGLRTDTIGAQNDANQSTREDQMLCASLAALILGTIAFAASGCGGSANALTRDELVAKANAICKTANNYRHSTLAHKSGAAYRAALAQIGKNEQVAVVSLRKLTAPSSISGDWKQIVDAEGKLAEDTVELGEYVQEHNRRGARLLINVAGPVEEQMSALANKDGLRDCARFG